MRLDANETLDRPMKTVDRASTLNTTLLLLSVCGRRLFPQSRVVGGEKSTFGKWPWQLGSGHSWKPVDNAGAHATRMVPPKWSDTSEFPAGFVDSSHRGDLITWQINLI
ncbi:hypothetical protein RUM44_006653 [Polyplax serrata]